MLSTNIVAIKDVIFTCKIPGSHPLHPEIEHHHNHGISDHSSPNTTNPNVQTILPAPPSALPLRRPTLPQCQQCLSHTRKHRYLATNLSQRPFLRYPKPFLTISKFFFVVKIKHCCVTTKCQSFVKAEYEFVEEGYAKRWGVE